mmetsp:Transcript_92572/g.241183  ORF Transcript_92572/g.241183 Transcript_92572/m.241183 type:complete len:224 (+) Transcript_92572:852-1523(+)
MARAARILLGPAERREDSLTWGAPPLRLAAAVAAGAAHGLCQAGAGPLRGQRRSSPANHRPEAAAVASHRSAAPGLRRWSRSIRVQRNSPRRRGVVPAVWPRRRGHRHGALPGRAALAGGVAASLVRDGRQTDRGGAACRPAAGGAVHGPPVSPVRHPPGDLRGHCRPRGRAGDGHPARHGGPAAAQAQVGSVPGRGRSRAAAARVLGRVARGRQGFREAEHG